MILSAIQKNYELARHSGSFAGLSARAWLLKTLIKVPTNKRPNTAYLTYLRIITGALGIIIPFFYFLVSIGRYL